MILTTLFSFISNVWNSKVEEIRLALEIRILLRLSKLNLSLSEPSDGSSDGSNDKDEEDGWSAKCSFDQFNADELAEEQASNRIRGANDHGDLSVFSMPFRPVCINSRVGLQAPNRMEGANDADDFGESYVLFCTILLTPDRLFRTLRGRRAGASGPLLLSIVWSSKLAVTCSLYYFITASLQRRSLCLLFLGMHYRRPKGP